MHFSFIHKNAVSQIRFLLQPVEPGNLVMDKLNQLQLLSTQESVIHNALFWVAISMLQLDQTQLYASGLALLEQNLHTLDSNGAFDHEVRDI